MNWTNDFGAGGWGNSELQYYTARTNNVRIESGHLVIEARKENFAGASYTSARLKTQGKVSWTYGRIEARLKVPRGLGLWPAFWMLGTNFPSAGWPACGEIDIMENIGREPARVHGTVHGPGYSGNTGIGGAWSLPGGVAFADDFHVFAIEWTTNLIKWFVDGAQYASVNPERLPGGASWVFNRPQFLLLNVAVGGNWPGNPDATTVFPQRLLVDYVRVYAPTNLPGCATNALTNPGFEVGGLASWTTYGAGFNTVAENIRNVPVHDGTNGFKLFGQFSGSENLSGVLQDVPAAPGQSFTANGWVFTPADDSIAGGNTAWLEVTFQDASNRLGLYRSAVVSTNWPIGLWVNLAVTNQFDPVTYAPIGSVTNLVAPAGTITARYQAVFRQPQSAAGAVLFDDLKLLAAPVSELPVAVSAGRTSTELNLTFRTFLGRPYQVRFKNDLADGEWQVLTNAIGDGMTNLIADVMSVPQRFYRVACACDLTE